MPITRPLAAAALAATLALAACSGDEDAATAAPATAAPATAGPARPSDGPGVVLVSPADAAEVLASDDAPVVLDIRTPEEFAEGHVAEARNIDFYDPGFATALEALPRDTTYVMYCNSGNRSASAAALMRRLGFTEVYEVDGGIQAWKAAGLPLV